MRKITPGIPTGLVMIASIAIVVAGLHFAKDVLVPFTLAVLFSFLLAPLCDVLERWRLGRIPSVIVATMLAVALLLIVTWTVFSQVTELASNLEGYKDNIKSKIDTVQNQLKDFQHRVLKTTDELGEELAAEEPEEVVSSTEDRTYWVRMRPPPTQPFELVRGLFGTVFQVLATAGIVVVLVIFFLIRREDLRDRFIRLIGRGQVTATTQAMDDAASRLSRYLLMQLLINASYGAPVALGLYFLGIPNAMLWGVLAAVLRFIPYLGPWIAASLPILLSLAIDRGWTIPLLTVGMFLVLELFSNNVMEPWLYGTRTGVSPVAVLMAAVFWTWLWGGVGLLLSTPLTVCLVVLGKYVPQLSFLGILLGDQPVFDPKTRLYQRLLAADQQESAELVEEFLDDSSLIQLYDELLLPALAHAERDHHRGDLDDSRHRYVGQSIREVVEELGDRFRAKSAETKLEEVGAAERSALNQEADPTCILCLPARDEADEVVAMMYSQLLEFSGFKTASASTAALVSEMVELVEKHHAEVVCISALPPATVAHTRYLCKRLLARFPNLKIIVGFWSNQDLSRAKARIGSAGSITLVGSLVDALHEVRRIKQPASVNRIEKALEASTTRSQPSTDGNAKRP